MKHSYFEILVHTSFGIFRIEISQNALAYIDRWHHYFSYQNKNHKMFTYYWQSKIEFILCELCWPNDLPTGALVHTCITRIFKKYIFQFIKVSLKLLAHIYHIYKISFICSFNKYTLLCRHLKEQYNYFTFIQSLLVQISADSTDYKNKSLIIIQQLLSGICFIVCFYLSDIFLMW